MKIAMVTPYNVRCGIASYSKDLSEALVQEDVEVYIVRLPRFGLKTPEILNTVVETIPLDRVELIHVQHEYGLYTSLEEGFYRTLRTLEKPIVTTMHAIGNFELDGFISVASDRIIVHNDFCFRRFSFPKKTIIIPHGSSSVECPPQEESRKSIGIHPDAPIVGYLGFISTYKGLETLIEAMKEIPAAALLIGGGWHTGPDTSYISKLKLLSQELLEGRCQWLGYVPDEKLSSAYGAMDIVVYPSRFATESGALLKALSHGKATIANDLPPFAEKEDVGAIITFKNLVDLRRKIRMLLRDEDTRSNLEAGARRYVEENSWKKVAEMHYELYEKLLSSTP